MLNKRKLKKDLFELRELIIDDNSQREKTVKVCSDQAIIEIINKMPLKISDFLAVSGLDKNFIDDYAPMFLKVLNDSRLSSTKEVLVSKSANKVLHHYKDRLTNISKNNRNLYLGQIESVRSFDLFNIDNEDELKIFLDNPKPKALELSLNALELNALTTLYRATNKDYKETGSYNLYIAYPFVEGIYKKEKFPIKAPLLYFPIKLIRKKRTFSIIRDIDKDIILNRDLLLLTSKIESSSIDSNMPVIDRINSETLKEVLLYYKNNDIDIDLTDFTYSFSKFKSQLKEDFIKEHHPKFTLKSYLTMGRYQPYSSMIQKDMDTILTSNKYNELLDGLIGEENLYSEEKDFANLINVNQINEENLSYINDLNDAQEKVVELLNKEKKLVIWGPPGTGKSQTITSLIASSVLKGENVLVVSEKKVALDVIYSRLKDASKYTMFVDDAENKLDFYNKLKLFIDPIPPVRTINNDIYVLEQEIIDLTNKLDESIRLMYLKENNNYSINDIYERYIKDKEIKEDLTPLKVFAMFNSYYKNLSLDTLEKIDVTFDKKKSLEDYLLFKKMINDYPILLKLETKITRSGKIELENFSNDYQVFKSNYTNASRFRRRKLYKEFISKNSLRLSFLTKNKRLDTKLLKIIIKDVELLEFITINATSLDRYLTKHNSLTKDELIYLDILLYDELLKDFDVTSNRKYLIDAYYTGLIEDFKAKNQENLYIMDSYVENLEKINELIDDKMNISIESFEMELYKNALNFSNTKRIMDIKRIIEATKRPSVKSFIDTYHPEMMENVKVWMMTPEVVSAIIPLLYGMFDLVIFDEASQMYVEKGIPAIYRAKKVVIAGDPKQLRPSSLGMGRIIEEDDLYENDELLDVSLDSKSLLDLARYKYRETLLNYHYRSKYEELIAFSNHAFYDGKLIVAPNQKMSSKPPIEYVYLNDAIYQDRRNHREAVEVIDIIKKIFRQRKNNESIGVITFNSTQRDLIEKYIDKELFKTGPYQTRFDKELVRVDDNEDKSLFVKNIENVQGDERDIIIFSMGYGKDKFGKISRRFGWLNNVGGQNRLNVAITRAKSKIYFVSSLLPDELHVEDLTNEGPLLLKNFMKYSYYVSNKQSDQASLVLQSLSKTVDSFSVDSISELVLSIKQRLERNKYLVETSIGIGSYNIDLAIYDKDNKEYLLGIICDVKNPVDATARKDMLHQERYLKSRNWTIYRLFSSNWYTDPNKEMRNIRDLLKQSKKN